MMSSPAWLAAIETQITYEDQIAALRARVDRVTSQQSLDKEQVKQPVKALLERQATFEQRTSPLADESIQTRNGWPASGTVESSPLLSPIERPSAPIVAIPAESAKQANKVTIGHKKAHRPHRKHARVIRKRTHKPPTIAAGAYAGPANQQNY